MPPAPAPPGAEAGVGPPPGGTLDELLRRAAAGEPLDLAEVVPLTRAGPRPQRGLAKRLLAVLLTQQARRDAARLLCEACDDLDFRQPVVLEEALRHLHELGAAEPLFALQARAAEVAARQHDHVTALVRAQNAAATDFRLGGRCISSPSHLRRLIGVYERVAAEARDALGVRPAARGVPRSRPGGRLRLAHVTCQLVDGGHAPSQVVRTLLDLADRERFDNCLVITEALARHAQHREAALVSDPSDRRAPQLLRHIRADLGMPVLRPRTLESFLAAAADLHAQLAEQQVDVAFFHGSIATPTDWLLCAWQAAPWQFDRGFGTPLFCPAVHYQFFELAPTMETLAFLCRERGIPYGLSPNGSVDFPDLAGAEPFPRAELGIPADHVILGTIGNHLPKRLSPAFCRTLAGVLRACPRTTYVVVGPGPFDVQVRLFGPDLVAGGPAARVRFVGPSRAAARWTRTLDIYVNEYPAGGGLAVCEAMAAGKPVVCMQADRSALAAVGAVYVGAPHLVRPPTDEAYARRLAELIGSPAERARLGAALRQRYEQEFDPRRFVAQMTDTIWEVVQRDRRAR